MKVVSIVGARPQFIKAAVVSKALRELEGVEEYLVHTGQHFDDNMSRVFFDEMGIPESNVNLGVSGGGHGAMTGSMLAEIEKILECENPDWALVYGDTNSCISAIAAKRHKIPLFHMEAGNRSFDERVPEEINRRIVDHISDINMPLTEHARRYLIREGIDPESIIKTGSCMEEVLDYYSDKIEKSTICDELNLKPRSFFLVSSHREENVDTPDRLISLLECLNSLADEYKIDIIFSVHPRTQSRLDKLDEMTLNSKVKFMKAMGFMDFIKLQKEAFCVISDSGTISEEASLLSIPAITIRQAHERPEGMDEGLLIMSDLEPNNVLNAVRIVVSQDKKTKNFPKRVKDYQGGNVSIKVVRTIHSYTDYINRIVWRK